MGFSAYKTSDTNKTFVNKVWGRNVRVPKIHRATLLMPCGEKVTGEWDGYGRIVMDDDREVDIYAAASALSLEDAIENNENLRKFFFEDFDNRIKKIKIVENPELNYEDVEPSKSCSSQGFFHGQ